MVSRQFLAQDEANVILQALSDGVKLSIRGVMNMQRPTALDQDLVAAVVEHLLGSPVPPEILSPAAMIKEMAPLDDALTQNRHLDAVLLLESAIETHEKVTGQLASRTKLFCAHQGER